MKRVILGSSAGLLSAALSTALMNAAEDMGSDAFSKCDVDIEIDTPTNIFSVSPYRAGVKSNKVKPAIESKRKDFRSSVKKKNDQIRKDAMEKTRQKRLQREAERELRREAERALQAEQPIPDLDLPVTNDSHLLTASSSSSPCSIKSVLETACANYRESRESSEASM